MASLSLDTNSALAQAGGQTLHLASIPTKPSPYETRPCWPTLVHHVLPPNCNVPCHTHNSSQTTNLSDRSIHTVQFIDEPLFFPAYLADSRATSTTSLDRSMSTQSIFTLSGLSTLVDNDFEINTPELLAEDLTYVEDECVYAQAIHIVCTGPPKMIDMTRTEYVTPKRASQLYFRRPAQRPFISPIQPPPPRSSSIGSMESHSSRSSGDRETTSTADSAPSTPILEADEPGTPNSEQSPTSPSTPKMSLDEHDRDFALPPTDDVVPVHAQSSFKSYMKSSRLRLLPRRTTSAIPHALPEAPESPRPYSIITSTRPKMMARGASERGPVPQLPPSPTSTQAPPFPGKHNTFEASPTPKSKSRTFSRPHVLRRKESKMGLNSA